MEQFEEKMTKTLACTLTTAIRQAVAVTALREHSAEVLASELHDRISAVGDTVQSNSSYAQYRFSSVAVTQTY